jgi:gamma-glutamylcyclotransferase
VSRFDDAVRAPFYFAYGSNMNAAQMRARVPGSELLGTATLKGHEFLFSGYSETWRGAVANVRRKTGKSVFGVVYVLPPGGLGLLDRYEGYPRSYQRKSAAVRMNDDGSRLSAVLYYKRATEALAPPSPAYVNTILAALKRHGAN